jgi:hypothetical protein
MPRILSSLIQSNFGGDHGNFEAVVLEGDSLVHWFRDNEAPNSPWKRGQVIVPSGAAVRSWNIVLARPAAKWNYALCLTQASSS